MGRRNNGSYTKTTSAEVVGQSTQRLVWPLRTSFEPIGRHYRFLALNSAVKRICGTVVVFPYLKIAR